MEDEGPKILVADDEPSLCDAIEMILRKSGYRPFTVCDGANAVEVFFQVRPDLVVLDVMMPKLDGFKVCDIIRKVDPDVPILMLSAKSTIDDKEAGFGMGADDYVTKPFDDKELVLRVDALLRRGKRNTAFQPQEESREIQIDDLVVDLWKCEVTVRGCLVNLTLKEFQIVALMASAPGKVFTREELIEQVWGDEYLVTSISIPAHIRHIREKIEEDPSNPQLIQTAWRFGYRLKSGS